MFVLIFSFLFHFSFHSIAQTIEPTKTAPVQGTVPSDYPAYEEEINGLLNLFNQNKLHPQYLQFKFTEAVNKRRRAVYEYEANAREAVNSKNDDIRKEFDLKTKEEIKNWRKDNPKGDFSQFQKGLSDKRKIINDQASNERKKLSADLAAGRRQMDEFLKIRREEFNKKHSEYVKSYGEKTKAQAKELREKSPVLKEFEEIPNGPATVLGPSKEPKE